MNMKMMKRMMAGLLLLAGLALLTLPTQAQQYGSVTIFNNSIVSAGGTSNLATITLTKNSEVGLDFSFKSMDSGSTSNVTVSVFKSFDGSNFETAAGISWAMPLTGTAVKRYCTNFNVGTVGYLRVAVANGDTGAAMTNVTVRAFTKPNRQE